MREYFLEIAELIVRIRFIRSTDKRLQQPPRQYFPFKLRRATKPTDEELLLSLDIDDDFDVPTAERGELIGWFYTGVGQLKHGVFRRSDGSYYFIFNDVDGRPFFRMLCNNDFRCNTLALGRLDIPPYYAFNNAIMIAYAFAAASRHCLLMHSSIVLFRDKAYCFLGKSGTGKSTHSSLWLKNFAGTRLLNDDNPVFRIEGGTARVFGSPWSGKTPCYRQASAEIAAVVMLRQASENKLEQMKPVDALAAMLISCASMMWDKKTYDQLLHTMSELIRLVGVHRLSCRPTDEAALLSFNSFVK